VVVRSRAAGTNEEERVMAKFVQIIEYKTSKIDESLKIDDEFSATQTKDSPARHVLVCSDRDNKGRYFTIVEFDSYEDAMANSDSPETKEFSEKQMKLADGPPTFYNLDVLREVTP
jgi:hypothetical protein